MDGSLLASEFYLRPTISLMFVWLALCVDRFPSLYECNLSLVSACLSFCTLMFVLFVSSKIFECRYCPPRTELLGIWCGRRREYQIIEAGCLGLESGRVGGRAPLPDRNLSPYHRPAHYQHPDNSKYKYATDKMQWKLIFQDAHSHKTLLLVIRNNIWL